MPKSDEMRGGRRRTRVAARAGLFFVFAGREKHRKLAAQTPGRRPRVPALRSNWAADSDILNWHAAVILVPYRSRVPAD
jgi:hypothetical protein